MESSAPLSVPSIEESKSFFYQGMTFVIHTLLVYACALRLSPWLVYHWFGWILPMTQLSMTTPAGDWYLQHLVVASIIPALVVGYINVSRFFPQTVRSYLGVANLSSIAVWSWVIPVLVLVFRMALYKAPNSVFYDTWMSTIKYFFDVERVMPTPLNPYASDPIRVWVQMSVTAPFYAGIAYSLGALESRRRMLKQLFTFETREEQTNSPD